MTEKNPKFVTFCCALIKNPVTQINHYFMQWFTGHYAPDFNSSPAQTSINVNVNDLQILMTAAHNQNALKKIVNVCGQNSVIMVL